MSEWTETARRALEDYCARSRTALAGTGADANEVIEDLRRHVDEEVANAKLSIVTEEDVRRILARVGEPNVAGETPAISNRSLPSPAERPKKEKVRPGIPSLFFGVVLPVITLLFELFTSMSAGILFDPMPSWLHVALVALVPVANFLVWRAARRKNARHARLLGWLNGAALGIAVYYAALYLPFTPIAGIGMIFYGLGLIPLTPLLSVAATPWLRAVYRKRTECKRFPGALGGFAAGLGLLAVLQLPTALTHYGLALATAEESSTRAHGLRVLRWFGDEEMLLRACYQTWRGEPRFDLVAELASGSKRVNSEEARDVYYRVTGRPFNSVPPPSLYARLGRWTELENEFTWDDALGGEAVAGRVKGLSLSSSRMDAITEPNAALAYCEWTMEFKNVSTQQREARAQIALPPGAVVSRLTLWINGEEREAAFGGRAQVRQAYQEVAVVRRRDPVLVTTCGPDRVLMQCFPVPANGGVMKIRLGITAPLALDAPDRGRFLWPRFLERNFRVGEEFKHSLWIESPMPLTCADKSATASHSTSNQFAIRLGVSEASFANGLAPVIVQRPAAVETVLALPDAEGNAIRQTIRAVAAQPPGRLVFVFDGSAGLKSHLAELVAGLSELPPEMEIAAVLAEKEDVTVLLPAQKFSKVAAEELRRGLRRAQFGGGQDNLPALEAAWDLAAASGNGVLIWIHAPQAVLLSSGDGLRQRFERTAAPPRFFELQVTTGPDRVVEKLDGLPVEHVPRGGALRTDLANLTAQLVGTTERWQFVREKIKPDPGSASAASASKHVERLWARDEVRRLTKARRTDEAAKLAAREQLVTPVSGAVVLETLQQFAQHGLTPADASTVPSVPEPGTWALMGIGLVVFAVQRWLRRRVVGQTSGLP
ncbi:MAG: PEP-CTERM sorting domain-containing protein [Pedosphaera sp.]|nr:PEP-CTERM sorting domain-containing protein [Pedosphaera sp.]